MKVIEGSFDKATEDNRSNGVAVLREVADTLEESKDFPDEVLVLMYNNDEGSFSMFSNVNTPARLFLMELCKHYSIGAVE